MRESPCSDSAGGRQCSKARPDTARPLARCAALFAATAQRRGGGSHCATRGVSAAEREPPLANRTRRARSEGAARSHAAHRHPANGRVRRAGA
eukprot:scaffold95131_cov62-Phaeocystis_antarctica.AAC.2